MFFNSNFDKLLNVTLNSIRTAFEYPVERGDITLLITHPFGYSEMTLLNTMLREIIPVVNKIFHSEVEATNIKCERLKSQWFHNPINGDQISITVRYVDDFEGDKGVFTVAFDIKPRDGFVNNSDRAFNSWAVLEMFATAFPPLTDKDVLEMLRQHGSECDTCESANICND